MKNRKRVVEELISILGMIIVLTVAYQTGNWLHKARLEASSSLVASDFAVYALALSWTRLLVAGLLLLLTWFVLFRQLPGLLTALVYTVVGLVVLFSIAITFLTPYSLPWDVGRTGFISPFIDTGAAIAVIGIGALGKIVWQRWR